jgi:hypothetical protein
MTNDEGGEEHDLVQNFSTKSPLQTKIKEMAVTEKYPHTHIPHSDITPVATLIRHEHSRVRRTASLPVHKLWPFLLRADVSKLCPSKSRLLSCKFCSKPSRVDVYTQLQSP